LLLPLIAVSLYEQRMARTLDFTFGGNTIACSMEKVDRKKLYGFKTTEILNGDEEKCSLATLASDGRTLIPSGGVALASFSDDGRWLDKSELKAVNLEGEEIVPVKSSFGAPIPLTDEATIDEYLSHNVRMVYELDAEEGIDDALLKALKGGKIFKFSYSFRGGLMADAAFMLMGDDDTVWMAVGSPTDIQFISYEQAATLEEEDDGDSEDDDGFDFGMM